MFEKCLEFAWKYFFLNVILLRLTSTSCSHSHRNSSFFQWFALKMSFLLYFQLIRDLLRVLGCFLQKRDWIRWDSAFLRINSFVRSLFELIWNFCIVYVIYVNCLLKAQYFNVSTALKLNLILFTSNGPHGVDSVVQKTPMLSVCLLIPQHSNQYISHFSYAQNVYDCVHVCAWANCQGGFNTPYYTGSIVASTTEMKRKRYALCIA